MMYEQMTTGEKRSFRNKKRFCEICSTEKKLCVDHNHTTGLVRGVLCVQCNGWLSVFESSRKNNEKRVSKLERKLTLLHRSSVPFYNYLAKYDGSYGLVLNKAGVIL